MKFHVPKKFVTLAKFKPSDSLHSIVSFQCRNTEQRERNERQISTRVCAIDFTIARHDKALIDTRGFEEHWSLNAGNPSHRHSDTNEQGISVVSGTVSATSAIGLSWTLFDRPRRVVSNKVPSVSRSFILLMLRSLIALSGFVRQRTLSVHTRV